MRERMRGSGILLLLGSRVELRVSQVLFIGEFKTGEQEFKA